MNTMQKRFTLFLLGCIPSRIFIAYLASVMPLKWLPIMGYIALIPAIGFAYLFISGSRKTGGEVFGDKIWWNNLRPFHSFMYFWFAVNAIQRVSWSWKILAADVIVGLIMFLMYHFYNGDFAKL